MKTAQIGTSGDKITQIAVENSPASLIPESSILVVVRSGILARTVPVARTTRPLTVNQDIKALCPSSELSARFLHYFMEAAEPEVLKLVTRGATVHRISTDSLRSLALPLPPFPEQQRIVAILDEAFAGLATATVNAEKNLANARELLRTEIDRQYLRAAKHGSGHSLATLIDVIHGFAFDGRYFEGGASSHPILLTPGNYTENADLKFDVRNTKRYSGEVPPRYVLNRGDLTIVMTDLSSKMKILGKPAFIRTSGILHNQRIGRVAFKDNQLHPDFLYYFMLTSGFSAMIKKSATGTMVRHTAPTRITSARIGLPCRFEDQVEIAAVLRELSEEIGALDNVYREGLAQIAALRQSILAKAFSGELTSARVAA